MNKWTYLGLCMIPTLLIALTFGGIVLWGQDHSQRDCLRYVSAHVTTNADAWRHLVCHR